MATILESYKCCDGFDVFHFPTKPKDVQKTIDALVDYYKTLPAPVPPVDLAVDKDLLAQSLTELREAVLTLDKLSGTALKTESDKIVASVKLATGTVERTVG
jgi:hypothetical protein